MSSPVETLQTFLRLLDQARAGEVQEETARLRRVDLELANLSTPAPYNARGWGLVFPVFGQAAGASLVVDLDGVEVTIQPGAELRTPFQRMEVRRAPKSAPAGAVTLLVLTHPDTRANLGLPAGGGADGAQYAAAHNVTNNLPTSATQGVSLAGARGVRAVVIAIGSTITSGLGVWWLYDDLTGVWAESSIAVDLSRTTAREAVALPDEFTTVGRGRAFLEVRSGINPGVVAFTVNLYAN